MKSPLILSAIAVFVSASAFAQTPVQQVVQDNHAVHQDNRAVAADKNAIVHDEAKIDAQRGRRDAAVRAEQRDLRHGDVAGAERMQQAAARDQQAINHEKGKVTAAKQNLQTDRAVRGADLQTRRQDAAALR